MGRPYIGQRAQVRVPDDSWEVVELLKREGKTEPQALREIISAGAKQILKQRRKDGAP